MRSTLSVAFAVAWRVLNNVVRNPSLLSRRSLFPLFFFTAFAGGLSRVNDVFEFPAGYTAFQFVFVLLQSAAFGGVFTGFGIARDFEHGFARRLLIAAPHRQRDRPRLRARGGRALADHGHAADGRRALHRGHGGRRRRRRHLRALPARAHGQRRGRALGDRDRDARPLDAGRAADADARLPGALLRAGLRAARLPRGLDRGGRDGEPAHAAARDRPRLHRRRPAARSRSRSCAALGLAIGFAVLGPARPAQGRGGRAASRSARRTRAAARSSSSSAVLARGGVERREPARLRPVRVGAALEQQPRGRDVAARRRPSAARVTPKSLRDGGVHVGAALDEQRSRLRVAEERRRARAGGSRRARRRSRAPASPSSSSRTRSVRPSAAAPKTSSSSSGGASSSARSASPR